MIDRANPQAVALTIATLTDITLRPAQLDDVDELLRIEACCFATDRLTRRSFRHWIRAEHSTLLVAEHDRELLGYGLVWSKRGTRLSRMYSLAILPQMRRQGLAGQLLTALEMSMVDRGRLFMRLELTGNNQAAMAFFQRQGYRVFSQSTPYGSGDSVLHMQKTIKRLHAQTLQRQTPWYQQTTTFTCGPAALMMAMASLGIGDRPNQLLELDIWREATSIYMTSGHGGCHPLGLALAAADRGFVVDVWLSSHDTLFVEGVRTAHKKAVLEIVHQQFRQRAEEHPDIELHYGEIDQVQIQQWLQSGYAVVILISTYQLDGKKAPHWVTVTGIDEHCLYVHDPDLEHPPIDCQYLPIARDDFNKMSAFGSGRLRTALAIRGLAEIR